MAEFAYDVQADTADYEGVRQSDTGLQCEDRQEAQGIKRQSRGAAAGRHVIDQALDQQRQGEVEQAGQDRQAEGHENPTAIGCQQLNDAP